MTQRETKGIQQAREHFRDHVDGAVENGVHTVITRHGKPVAVLVPYRWYQDVACDQEHRDENG